VVGVYSPYASCIPPSDPAREWRPVSAGMRQELSNLILPLPPIGE